MGLKSSKHPSDDPSDEPRGQLPTSSVSFDLRPDELTTVLTARIADTRREGRLRSVTLDCRRTGYDDTVADALEQAAGRDKLVFVF